MIRKEQLTALAVNDSDVKHLSEMTRQELSALLGPFFSAMKDYDQDNPHHHLDLLRHTLSVVLNIPHDINPDIFLTLRIAALFHDIGKPLTAMDKGDRHVFYGHPEKSWEVAKPLLLEIGFHEDDVRKIGFFIAFHDAFISFKSDDEMPTKPNPSIKAINRQNVDALIASVRQKQAEKGEYVPSLTDFYYLMLLCIADAKSQAEQTISHGKLIDTRERKTARMTEIQNIVKSELPSA